MASFKALSAQIEVLRARAEDARKKESRAMVQQIKTLMAEYNLTAEDLFGKKRGRRGKAQSAPSVARYRNPETGQTWTGRGRAPGWFDANQREAFAI